MNNRFILILSFAMTISLVIFISLQLYWVRGYYSALEQDFSNKVHSVLETTTKKIEGIEIEQYLNVEYPNFGKTVVSVIHVLIYHGRSFNDLVMAVKEFTHERNDLLMEELLKKRHLAPIYGERTPLASELEDYLVIDEIPDIFHTGHVHINTYRKFNGIHLIN